MTDEQSSSDPSLAPIDSADPDRFEQRAHLGAGGTGNVSLAFDRLMMRWVALKTLHAHPKALEDRKRYFLQEARLTGQLDHPNIVPAYDLETGGEGELPTLIMKYVDGEPYSALIEQLHASPTDEGLYEALQVFLKVCDAVSFAHERGFIHCDLKPENVMVGKHGQVYVMDWGAAFRRARARNAESDSALEELPESRDSDDAPLFGSLGYMAPEQLTGDGEAISATTDVYGLGGILCALVTSRPPRHGVGDVADWHTTPSIEDRRGAFEVPPQLCRIAERALNPAQAKRFQSVDELKSTMQAFMAGGGWFETRSYLAGDIIIREGDLSSDAFIISSGVCDVFKGYAQGSREVIRSMGSGDAFGELAVLTRKRRTATVVARTDVELRLVTPEALDRELKRNPVLASFMSAVTARFADLDARLDSTED